MTAAMQGGRYVANVVRDLLYLTVDCGRSKNSGKKEPGKIVSLHPDGAKSHLKSLCNRQSSIHRLSRAAHETIEGVQETLPDPRESQDHTSPVISGGQKRLSYIHSCQTTRLDWKIETAYRVDSIGAEIRKSGGTCHVSYTSTP